MQDFVSEMVGLTKSRNRQEETSEVSIQYLLLTCHQDKLHWGYLHLSTNDY